MKYCLKPKAKETLKEFLITIIVKLPLMIIAALAFFGFVILPLVIAQGYPSDLLLKGCIAGKIGTHTLPD